MSVSTLQRPQELAQVQLSLESDFRFLINDKSLKIFSTTIKSKRVREMSSILSISFSASFFHSPILLYLYHIKISTWIIDEFEFFFSFFLLSSFYRINQSSWWWNVNFRSSILFCVICLVWNVSTFPLRFWDPQKDYIEQHFSYSIFNSDLVQSSSLVKLIRINQREKRVFEIQFKFTRSARNNANVSANCEHFTSSAISFSTFCHFIISLFLLILKLSVSFYALCVLNIRFLRIDGYMWYWIKGAQKKSVEDNTIFFTLIVSRESQKFFLCLLSPHIV